MSNGKKNDTGKPRLGMIPLDYLEGLARVYEEGAMKYGEGNFRKFEPTDAPRFLDALMRHAAREMAGEVVDPESSNHSRHRWKIVWNAIQYAYLADEGERQGEGDKD